MRIHRSVLYLGFTLISSEVGAAQFGALFETYVDMHQKTSYGSLFFNEGAIREVDSRNQKKFRLITGTGVLSLPSQQGYCFVFNHYDSPSKRSTVRYKGKIVKSYKEGDYSETISRTFVPTMELESANLPDLCISGIEGVSKVAIEFSSDDGRYLHRTISFDVK